MKKILIILLLFITTFSFSQVISREAYALKIDNKQVTSENILITFDLDLDKITIYSSIAQHLDIETSSPVLVKDGYTMYQYYVNDSEYKHCYVQLWLSDIKKDVVRMIYSDITYEYFLRD